MDWLIPILSSGADGAESGGFIASLFRPESGNWRDWFLGWAGLARTLPIFAALVAVFMLVSRWLFPARQHAFTGIDKTGYPGALKPCDHGLNEVDFALLILGGIVVYFVSATVGAIIEHAFYPETLKSALRAAQELDNPEQTAKAIKAAYESISTADAQTMQDARFIGMLVNGAIRSTFAIVVLWHMMRLPLTGRGENHRAVATFSPKGQARQIARIPILLLVWVPMATVAMWVSLSLATILIPEAADPDYRYQTQGVLESLLKPSSWQIPASIMTAVVAAALWEEFFFRGVLQGFMRRYVPWWVAGISAALIFTLVHEIWSSPQILVPVLTLGLGLSWVYERTGRIWVVVALHATHNGLVLLLANIFK